MTDNTLSIFNIQANRKLQQNFIKQRDIDQNYISELEKLLESHNIEIPAEIFHLKDNINNRKYNSNDNTNLQLSFSLEDGTLGALDKSLNKFMPYSMNHRVYLEFRNLTFWNMIPKKRRIKTVGLTLKSMIFGNGPTCRFDILNDLTGRIAPGKLTIVMGPPGSGKTTLLKALSNQLSIGSAHLEGEITYNSDDFKSNNYLPEKVSVYVDENDEHAPTLTVKETLEFAWRSTTGGHHSYQNTKDDESAKIVNTGDKAYRRVHNVMKVLGIEGCQDTIVGNGMLRGVSGGQKRRVTIAEMIVAPRRIAFMDAISNGLDSQTTLDIIKSMKLVVDTLGNTGVISLLQPAPEVFHTFDELILLGAGRILYHGSTSKAMDYFESLGYIVPKHMDLADFLQELPTPSGVKFIDKIKFPNAPIGIPALAKAWKLSIQHQLMIDEMNTFRDYVKSNRSSNTNNINDNNNLDNIETAICIETNAKFSNIDTSWPSVFKQRYPGNFFYHYQECLKRHAKLTWKDTQLVKSNIAKAVIISLISSTLFVSLSVTDSNTLMGILFFSCMTNGINGLASLPKIFEQKAVFYKHSKALFFPSPAFVLSQTIVMIPIQLLETVIFSCIVYWVVGFSSTNHGGRFFTFFFIIFLFTLTLSQFFRFIGSITSSNAIALPLAGVFLILFVLFSGYIINKNAISDGWIWFFYINPMAYALKALIINEFTSRDYDFQICSNYPACTNTQRFGDSVLEGRGFPTSYDWVWYSALILFAEYMIFIFISVIGYTYIRTPVVSLPTSMYNEDDYYIEQEIIEVEKSKKSQTTSSYKPPPDSSTNSDMMIQQHLQQHHDKDHNQYDVLHDNQNHHDDENMFESNVKEDRVCESQLSDNFVLSLKDLDSIKEISNQNSSKQQFNKSLFEDGDDSLTFEPISFAFKDIWYRVPLPKGEHVYLLRSVSGFLEPGTMTALMGSSGAGKTTLLDVLSGRKNTGKILGQIFLNGKPKDDKLFKKLIGYVEQFDTLSPQDTPREAVEFSAALRLPRGTNPKKWVDIVISLLELKPIESHMIGTATTGGMSFEQKKRVSIAVELAANPAILFLDEPTTGLDSRAAQVVIRCIKRVIACGRSVVCTIHQPSAYIFDEFDSLLLLQKGGQTVFFGDLGTHSEKLISYFESIPGVHQIVYNQNPASWMLTVISAGSSAINNYHYQHHHQHHQSQQTPRSIDSSVKLSDCVDFHRYYNESSLCLANTALVNVLCPDILDEYTGEDTDGIDVNQNITNIYKYNATYATQLRYLLRRAFLIYWRSPAYNAVRIVVNLILALLFSSAFVDQKYTTDVETISRVSLIYITTLMLGIIALQTVQPVIFAQRPSFYREKFIEIYDIKLYTIANSWVEVPYLIISSATFIVPFFFIVGFNEGDVVVKFFWYWLFEVLSITAVVFLGHFLASSLPNESIAAVCSGLVSTCFSLFCGFMIPYQQFPDFWKFMYWLTPLHYSVEGIVVTQFNKDNRIITLSTGGTETAQTYVSEYYTDWQYSHVSRDIVALCIFILLFRILTYFSLVFINHSKR